MNPQSIAKRYLSSRICCEQYAMQIERLAKSVRAFTAQAVNSHLRARLESLSPSSVANERRVLLTLWRWAWEEGLVDTAPRGVMRVRVPQRPVRAWTMAQCQALVKGAEKFSGRTLRNGADLGDFLACWALLAYETGARYGDIFSWTESNVCAQSISWSTSKTGVACVRPISAKAASLVQKMLAGSPDGRIVGWVCCRRQSFKFMRQMLIANGLGAGSSKWLRRSAATHVEMTRPGKAQAFLAHKTPGLAARHYLDQSQLVTSEAGPPPLFH